MGDIIQREKGTIHKIGGTYGCYGIVDPSMVFGTWKEANTMALKAKSVVKDTSGNTKLIGAKPSNKEQNRLVNTINTALKKYKIDKSEIYVNIQKNPSRRKTI